MPRRYMCTVAGIFPEKIFRGEKSGSGLPKIERGVTWKYNELIIAHLGRGASHFQGGGANCPSLASLKGNLNLVSLHIYMDILT